MLKESLSRDIVKRASGYLIIVLFYSCAAALTTYPLIRNMSTSFICDGEWSDSPMYIWGIYTFKDAVVHLQNPFFTDKLFYPLGTRLIMHTFTPIMGLFSLPLRNEILGANLFILLNFVLSALGAFHLCRYYTKNNYLSVIAGFIFAFCPYKLAHLHCHFNLMLTGAVPFFILFWEKAFHHTPAIRFHSKMHLAAAFLFFMCAFFSDYTYAFLSLMFVVFWFGYYGLKPYWERTVRKRFNILILALSVVLSNCVVLFLEYHHVPRTQFFLGSDILSFFVPSENSRLFAGEWTHWFHTALFLGDPWENTVFLGFVLIALTVLAVAVRRHGGQPLEQNGLFFFAACFAILSMPLVHIAGKSVCALPHAIFQYVPFINNFRAQSRYTVMMMLFLPIAVFTVLHNAWFRNLSNGRQMLFSTLILMMIGAEYVEKPYRLYSRDSVPKVYHYLASKPEGTLLEIPFGLQDGVSTSLGQTEAMNMYYQVVHHKKVLSGYISRLDRKKCDFFATDPLISTLLKLQQEKNFGDKCCSAEQVRASLSKFHLRYVLIYPEFRGGALEVFMKNMLSPMTESIMEFGRYELITLKYEQVL